MIDKDKIRGQMVEIAGEDRSKAVTNNPQLLWKAYQFFQKRLCRKCKMIVTSRAGQGQELKSEWLCNYCKRIYEKTITEG